MSDLGPNPLGGPVTITPGAGKIRFGVTIEAPATLPPVNILLQTVVEFGEKVDDGQLILAVTWPWYGIIEALEQDPEFAFRMTPRQWEEMVAGSYERAGAEVILTPASADRGRDLIATFHGLGKVRVLDQVNAYRPGHLVTADDVRALFGVVTADGASKGFLTTTSDFAPRLREDPLIVPHIGPRLELVNGTTFYSAQGTGQEVTPK